MSNSPAPSQTHPISCYVKHYTHLHFFKQLFDKTFPESTTLYLTDNLSLFIYARFVKNLHIKRIPLFIKKGNTNITTLSYRTMSVLNWEANYMQRSTDRVVEKCLNLIHWFEQSMPNQGISFCWSGNNTESHAFGQVAKKLGHLTFFGEITNYPQTVYLDTLGTNYFSHLATKLKSLEAESNSNPIDYVENLRILKTTQKQIPQASLKTKTQVFIALYGIQQFLFGSGKRFSIFDTLANKLKSLNTRESELIKKGESISVDNWKAPVTKSDKRLKILIPLQVNYDTQLHVFSDFKSSFEYIKYLLTITDSKTELHIKLHPAEKGEVNKLLTHIINKLNRRDSNIRLISSFDFSDYDAVATINSTFGIDALLADCKVITFGKSLYSDLDCVLQFDHSKFNSIRKALEAYNELVNSEAFILFAQIIQGEFYNFNYFGDTIDQGVSEHKFSNSITRLQKEIKTSLLSNHKK